MAVLGAAEERLLADGDSAFQGILVSVDPERDAPDLLQDYVASFSANFVRRHRFAAGDRGVREESACGLCQGTG